MEAEATHEVIYTLLLEGNYYYVGRTRDIDTRMKQHTAGDGSKWTALHPMLKLIDAIPCTHKLDEDFTVKKLMMTHGVDRVRGGSYSGPILPRNVVKLLKNEIIHAEDKCYKCGLQGHYAVNCTAKKKKTRRSKKVVATDDVRETQLKSCARCGRDTHTESKCSNKTLSTGVRIEHLKYCARCGRSDHSGGNYSTFDCVYKTRYDGMYVNSAVLYCQYCGMGKHTIATCSLLKTK
jgi:predicted GIY-YIG superfamily endonuclease